MPELPNGPFTLWFKVLAVSDVHLILARNDQPDKEAYRIGKFKTFLYIFMISIFIKLLRLPTNILHSYENV